MANKHIDFFEFNNSIFSMIREISHKIDLLLQETSTELGITTLQLRMLIALSSAGEPMSIGNLGRTIGVTGGNISNICKKLEKQGFVDRVRSEEDERVVNVELTEKGQEGADMIGEYFNNIREGIPEDEVDINLTTILEELEELDKLLDGFILRSGL